MKTTSRYFIHSTPHCRAAIAAAGVMLALTASHAQVVIEGGPGVIQISDRDGKPEPVVPGGVPQGAPIPFDPNVPGGGTPDAAAPRAVTMRPDPQSPVTVRVAAKPAPPVKPAVEPGSVVAAVPTVDVDAAKRKSEIIRDLGIADSGTSAKVAILTQNLYEKDSALITTVANPQLALLAEFIRLSPHREILVTYQFSPTLHAEGLAWDRSASLVEWMKGKGQLASSTFTVNEPTHLVETPNATPPVDPATTPPYGKVEVVINYR